MRATWMTDLHLSFLKPPALKEFLARVRKEKPDVLFVTGDTGEGPSVFDYLDMLAKIAPVYYVLGNHDFYGSDIQFVRDAARSRLEMRAAMTDPGSVPAWISGMPPVQLTPTVTLVGVDGWGDAQCGDPKGSKIKLNDWRYIQELRAVFNLGGPIRLETLRVLGRQEGAALRATLDRVVPTKKLFVLTHVPPFPEACVYNGKMSERDWLPWFTCIETGKVLAEYAGSHDTEITVLCGHTHGLGVYQHNFNLEVRTGGWPIGVKDYGNPIIQTTFELE